MIGFFAFFFLVLGLTRCTALNASISVLVNDGISIVSASHDDDISRIASAFCMNNQIAHERCTHFVTVELSNALWCEPGQKEIARSMGLSVPRTFRFVCHSFHHDSSEFSLLRPRLISNGFVECTSGLMVNGEEDAVWLLGHLRSGETRWIYEPFERLNTNDNSMLINAFPNAGRLGNKDEMFFNLERLGNIVGDAAITFLPRTWSPERLAAERVQDGENKSTTSNVLQGIWLQKDPQKELGSGIALVQDVDIATLDNCKECVVQRYVEDPFLLNGKKFSFGVYTAFTGVNPLSVWLHRELLILVCTRPYSRNNASDTLSHLSNGLLNRRLNPGDIPDCDGCEYNATDQVWTTERFLEYLSSNGVAWGPIETQVRNIILTTFTATADRFLEDLNEQVPSGRIRDKLFCHWRFDFLLDATQPNPKVWLLETEIVPSAGTIGGVDEVIKSVVLRDVLSLVGWGPLTAENQPDMANNDPLDLMPRFPKSLGTNYVSEFDSALCESQPHGSWSWKLCQKHLIFDHVPASLQGDASVSRGLKEWVVRMLEEAADIARYDNASIELIVKHEERRYRRVGYEPLIPAVPQMMLGREKGADFGYVAMDGSMGESDDSLAEAERLFLTTKATPSDFILWKWEAQKAKLRQRKNVMRELQKNNKPLFANLTDHYESCSQCINATIPSMYCASLIDTRVVSVSEMEPILGGLCIAEWQQCRDVPVGFVDGISLRSAKECSEVLNNGDGDYIDLLLLSKAFLLEKFKPLVAQTCKRAFSNVAKYSQLMCPSNVKREPLVISHQEFARRGALPGLFLNDEPVIVRNNGPPPSGWSPEAVSTRFGSALVRTIAFNQFIDSAQELFTAEIALSNFVEFSRDPSKFVVETQVASPKTLALYLLLTTRHLLEGVPSPESVATDPNAEFISKGGPLKEMLDLATSSFVDALLPTIRSPRSIIWREAWTSLRLGGKYRYPTHIDCFENIILQLYGNKTVKLLPPEFINVVRPDPLHKHWPSAGSTTELAEAHLHNGWRAHLIPGDQLYVPLMWFHAVEVTGESNWSVTANRYYKFQNIGESQVEPLDMTWREYIDGKKHPNWRSYEERLALQLC